MIFNPPKERIEYFKEHTKIPTDIWDPIKTFSRKRVLENCASLQATYEQIQKNPSYIKKIRNKSILIGILIALPLIYIGIQYQIEVLVWGIVVLGLSFFSVYMYLKKIAKDIIKWGIAQKNNWVYDPNTDVLRAREFMREYPEIFRKGDKGQSLDDQFWGTHKKISFTAGLFQYKVSSGRNNSSTTYHRHYYAIKSPKTDIRFHLYPEGIGSKVANVFTKKQINTESIAFNKAFAFSYKGKKEEKAIDIVRTLTPAVQQMLVDLKQKRALLEVLFAEDTIIFLFKGNLLKKLSTNFVKSSNIHDSDARKIEEELSLVLDTAKELIDILS